MSVLQRLRVLPRWSVASCSISTTSVVGETRAGKYYPTKHKTKPLTYDMAYRPQHIGIYKSWLSWHSGTRLPRWSVASCSISTTSVVGETRAGKYYPTKHKTKPLTYDMAYRPQHIGIYKSWLSWHSGTRLPRWSVASCSISTTSVVGETRAGKYYPTKHKTKPLTYDMAYRPQHIGIYKSWLSWHSGTRLPRWSVASCSISTTSVVGETRAGKYYPTKHKTKPLTYDMAYRPQHIGIYKSWLSWHSGTRLPRWSVASCSISTTSVVGETRAGKYYPTKHKTKPLTYDMAYRPQHIGIYKSWLSWHSGTRLPRWSVASCSISTTSVVGETRAGKYYPTKHKTKPLTYDMAYRPQHIGIYKSWLSWHSGTRLPRWSVASCSISTTSVVGETRAGKYYPTKHKTKPLTYDMAYRPQHIGIYKSWLSWHSGTRLPRWSVASCSISTTSVVGETRAGKYYPTKHKTKPLTYDMAYRPQHIGIYKSWLSWHSGTRLPRWSVASCSISTTSVVGETRAGKYYPTKHKTKPLTYDMAYRPQHIGIYKSWLSWHSGTRLPRWSVASCSISTTSVVGETRAGKYYPTKHKTKPLTYDMAYRPQHIGIYKSWLSWHSGTRLPRWSVASCSISTTSVVGETRAGKYYPTKHKTKPLTYDMAYRPQHIGIYKSWLSWHSGTRLPRWSVASCSISTTSVVGETRAGKYYPTKHKTKPLTYDMAYRPQHIGIYKSWLSWHSGTRLPRWSVASCSISTTSVVGETRAGKYYPTKHKTKPLTYDMAYRPQHIGIYKSWLSWHSGDLEETRDKSYSRAAKFLLEDMIVRKFMGGTWHGCLPHQLEWLEVIKRNGNLLRICGFINRVHPPRKIYWLIGYTEELLSRLLKQPVRLELQTLEKNEDATFIYI